MNGKVGGGGATDGTAHGSTTGAAETVPETAPETATGIETASGTLKQPVQGRVKHRVKRVVLTRPADRQAALANRLRHLGCEVLELPALTVSPICPVRQSANDAGVADWQPSKFDVLVFVSRGAWQYYHRFYLDTSGVDFLRATRLDGDQVSSNQHGSTQPPRQIPILACVGVSTAKQIADDLDLYLAAPLRAPLRAPLPTITYPKDGLSSDSEGLWALLKPQLSPNAKTLIVRGQTGRDWLADVLTRHGMSVSCLSVYRREPAAWSEEQLTTLKAWARDAAGDVHAGVGTWLITSAEGLAAIEQQYDFYGFTGMPGFAPERVIVVHERLVAPVRRWLAHWQTPIQTPADHGQAGAQSPVLAVAPDDEAIAVGILRVE